MTPELWERLKPLYNAALDLPEQGRTAYIEQLCQGDPELARELRALVEADQGASHTFDQPFSDITFFHPQRNSILAPGTLLVGRFRIVAHLGSGGMGDVYEAADLELDGGRIALKTLRPEIAGNPNALARFKAEVLLARKITGPNICRIHELYLTANQAEGSPAAFLTMELLEGITLHDHIEQHSPLPVAEVRLIAEQLCSALCCIHEAGIIHRDLKTRNVMLVPAAGGRKVVVMDFGLALISSPARGNLVNSTQGDAFVAGTPSYMAPEQFEGREAGPPTDIYAFGLILYEMATGIQPFSAHTPLAAAIRRSQQPRFASSLRHEVPTAWDDIIQRCLQYDPTRRFQTATQVTLALKHPGKFVFRFGRTRRFAIPRLAVVAAALALLLVLAATSWFLYTNAQRRKLAPDAARWFDLGMTALREGSCLKATRLLTEVTQRDPTYAVAHAALADAWSELDFTALAQHEMLLASSANEQRGLSNLERRYIDAVRTTLIHDYPAATEDYARILDQLPPERKADGYVDLGRSYEKVGNVKETLTAYEKAAQLNPDDPAPFLHLGTLRSRLRQPKAANEAFTHADALYAAESDLAGQGEVAYQRGYAANESGVFTQAKLNLNRSLAIAHQIGSGQLEVRCLSQLSSVAYREDQDDLAITYANQLIRAADASGLGYWSTDGAIRLATAYLGKEDFTAAETLLVQAKKQAEQNGHPRLSASADLTLASLRDQQKRWDEQIELANSALRFYQDNGFRYMAEQAEILILRGERNKGNTTEVLEAGKQLLQTAQQTGSSLHSALAEEFVGGALFRMERYPEALAHFEEGVRNLQSISQDPVYLQVHTAETLAELGRTKEAESVLDAISPSMSRRADIGSSIAVTHARLYEIENDLKLADRTAAETWQRYPSLHAESTELDRIAVQAQAGKGQLAEARTNAAHLASLAYARKQNGEAAQDDLLGANLALQAGDNAAAESLARSADQTFASEHMPLSEVLSLLVMAQAAQNTGDQAASLACTKKMVDIFRPLEQSWGVPTLLEYAHRPDRRALLQAFPTLHGDNGDLSLEHHN